MAPREARKRSEVSANTSFILLGGAARSSPLSNRDLAPLRRLFAFSDPVVLESPRRLDVDGFCKEQVNDDWK